jgi:hypothetical protein
VGQARKTLCWRDGRTQRQVAIVELLIFVAIVLAVTVSWIFGIFAIGGIVAVLDGARQTWGTERVTATRRDGRRRLLRTRTVDRGVLSFSHEAAALALRSSVSPTATDVGERT